VEVRTSACLRTQAPASSGKRRRRHLQRDLRAGNPRRADLNGRADDTAPDPAENA